MYKTNVYLDTTVTLTPHDHKTDIVFEFTVADTNDIIYIDTEYTPKFYYNFAASEKLVADGVRQYELDPATDLYDCTEASVFPLSNMIVLSLDVNGVYGGAAHRHANAQHIVLSEQQATNGFTPGCPPQGTWRVVLHAFCVLTDCCDYHIRVTGVRRYDRETEVKA